MVDTFKRELGKSRKELGNDAALTHFVSVYRLTPNRSTDLGKASPELKFAGRIKSIFHKLLPEKKKG